MSLAALRESLDSTNLPDGWLRCRAAEEVALASQLQRELLPGHSLFERSCTAVARHGACDDVLYFVQGDGPPLAVVHLTWQVPRDDRHFPWSTRFTSVAEWAASIPLPEGGVRGGFNEPHG